MCDYCAYDGKITIINSDFSYKYHNQIICKECAFDTIKNEINTMVTKNIIDILNILK